eukprot:GHVS01098338.1.p3 GENE.GHVS01098338.1~~GHVS01098338.1.p3  ORF type:complete len:112 (-),score=4.07 GHVS01098338.1:202-537(-)
MCACVHTYAHTYVCMCTYIGSPVAMYSNLFETLKNPISSPKYLAESCRFLSHLFFPFWVCLFPLLLKPCGLSFSSAAVWLYVQLARCGIQEHKHKDKHHSAHHYQNHCLVE